MGSYWIVGGVVLSILAALALVYLLVLVRPRGRRPQDESLLCDYAHRGLHGDGIPENSLAAFERACEAGVGIELDVQLSRDGTVMVFHDYTLARMTGREGKLGELDAAELTSLPLADSDQTIPTFEQVLSLVGGRVPLLVELKGEDLNTALCEKVASQLAAYSGAYCVESFNPLLLRGIRRQLPQVYAGLLYTNVCRDKKKHTAVHMALTAMALNVVAHPNFIAFNQIDRNALPVKIATGLYRSPKFAWTVRTEDEAATARKQGERIIFENISVTKNR